MSGILALEIGKGKMEIGEEARQAAVESAKRKETDNAETQSSPSDAENTAIAREKVKTRTL
jgi:hypothetical protein